MSADLERRIQDAVYASLSLIERTDLADKDRGRLNEIAELAERLLSSLMFVDGQSSTSSS
jgi:hypothetical protein